MDRRIVLVTGASRGLGRAAALAIARAGSHVILLARSETAMVRLDDEIRAETGRSASLIPMDLRDNASVDRLAGALLERFGRLDGLFANAGVLGSLGPLKSISPQSFAETLETNLISNWRLVRALHPLLRASPAGRALFTTSGAAPRPRAFWGAYAASKAGLEAMIACYADENENTPLRINLFDPGPTRTDMRFKAMPGEDRSLLPTPEMVVEQVPYYLSGEFTQNGCRLSYGSRTLS